MQAVIAIGSVVGGLLATAKGADLAFGTNIVTPKKKDYRVLAGNQEFSGSTSPQDFATGFSNYIRDLAAVAPHYVMRERPGLRASYKRAIEVREQSLDREAVKFKTLPTIHSPEGVRTAAEAE